MPHVLTQRRTKPRCTGTIWASLTDSKKGFVGSQEHGLMTREWLMMSIELYDCIQDDEPHTCAEFNVEQHRECPFMDTWEQDSEGSYLNSYNHGSCVDYPHTVDEPAAGDSPTPDVTDEGGSYDEYINTLNTPVTFANSKYTVADHTTGIMRGGIRTTITYAQKLTATPSNAISAASVPSPSSFPVAPDASPPEARPEGPTSAAVPDIHLQSTGTTHRIYGTT